MLVDDKDEGIYTPVGTSYGAISSIAFTVTAGSHTITLEGVNPSGQTNTALIDEVSVIAAPAPSDPGFAAPNVGTGAYGDFEYNPNGSPWTFTGAAGVAGNGSGFTSGNPNAPLGTQVGLVQGGGSTLGQSLTLAAGSYYISFTAAQRGNGGNHGGEEVEVEIDGQDAGTITPAGTSYAVYNSTVFTVGAGSHTIALVGVDPNSQDNTAFITQVAVVSTTSLADPNFQTPVAGTGASADYQADPSGSPWTFTSTAGVAGNGSTYTSANPPAPYGTQVGYVQGTGSVSQTIVLAAGSYVVTFQAAQRGSGNGSNQEIQVSVDGNGAGHLDADGRCLCNLCQQRLRGSAPASTRSNWPDSKRATRHCSTR